MAVGMTPPPRPFRLVYRAFDAFEFDPAKSEEVFEARGFDLAYARRVFPGYVLSVRTRARAMANCASALSGKCC